MNKTELRVGNLVNSADEGILEICAIKNRGVTSFNKDRHFRHHRYQWLEPIAITPEILLKCGFVMRDNSFIRQEDLLNLEYRLTDFHGWILSQGFFAADSEITTVKYVHQLQNLYFALTQTELEIKLP